MKNQKTIKIKLDHSNKAKLDKLEKAYELCQKVSTKYLKLKLKELETKDFKLTKSFYTDIRMKYPSLNSALIQQVMRRCDEQVKSYISHCKKCHKLFKFNIQPRMPILLRDTNIKISNNSSFDVWLSLWRIKYPLNLCNYHRKLFDRSNRCLGSKITKSLNGQFILHLTLEFKKDAIQDGNTLGIDIGIVKPIVCSDGKQIGSGKFIKHKKIEYGKKRAKNQRLKNEISSKQSRWTNDLNHKLSRELINYCLHESVNVLRMEKLKGTELSNKKYRKYNWAFKDLLNKIKYKAQIEGIKVISVNPAYTSQTCSQCGWKSKDNRKSQSLFICNECGTRLNADINAAKNICGPSATNGCTVSSTKSTKVTKSSEALNSEVTML